MIIKFFYHKEIPDYTLSNFKNYIFAQSIVAICYFYISKKTPYYPVELKFTTIDNFIKPHFIAFWIYISFFIFVMAGITFTSRENSLKCSKAIIINACVATIFYILFPTKITYLVYTPYIEQNSATDVVLEIIKKYDDTHNCFPSLHIANSVVATYFFNQNKKNYIQGVNYLWLFAIIWSVLSTKQHLFYDVLGGALLAFTSLMITLYPKSDNTINADEKLGTGEI